MVNATSDSIPGSCTGSGNVQADSVDPYGAWGLSQALGAAVGSAGTAPDWINVVSRFGADKTGARDCTAQFTAAFAAGKYVYVPAGTYKAAIVIPAGHCLQGAGWQATVIRPPSASANAISVNGTSSSAEVEFPAVSDLLIVGPGSGTGYGLYVSWSTAVSSFRNLDIAGFGSHGIYVTNTYNARFENIVTAANGGDGFHGTSNVNSCQLVNVLATGNAGSGISVSGAAGTKLDACTSEANAAHGIYLQSCFAGGVYDGDAEGNGTDGTSSNIYVDSACHAVSVRGVSLGGDGVTVANLTDAGTETRAVSCSFSPPAPGGNDIVLKPASSHFWHGSNAAIGSGHAALSISDASGASVAATSGNMISLLTGGTTATDAGWQAWNGDIAASAASNNLTNFTAGVVFLARLNVRAPINVSKIAIWWVQPSGGSPAGSTLALFNGSGTQVGTTTPDLTATAPGIITPSIGAQSLGAGIYHVACLIVTQGTTKGGPLLFASTPVTAFGGGTAFETVNQSPSAYRWASQLTGQASMPSSLTLGSNSTSLLPFWCALL